MRTRLKKQDHHARTPVQAKSFGNIRPMDNSLYSSEITPTTADQQTQQQQKKQGFNFAEIPIFAGGAEAAAPRIRPKILQGDRSENLAKQPVQRQEDEEPMQGKRETDPKQPVQPKINLAPSSSGKPMPEPVQQKMEGAFGADFSGVRIHEGPQAKAINAVAYTQGSDIHFQPGKYQPETQSGQELLGHELTHVVQQKAGRVTVPQGKGAPINADPGLESEADILGAKAARGESVEVAGAVSTGGIHKKEPRYEQFEDEKGLDDKSGKLDSGKKLSFLQRLKGNHQTKEIKEITKAFASRQSDVQAVIDSKDNIKAALTSEGKDSLGEINDKSETWIFKLLGEALHQTIQKIGIGISAVVTAGKSIVNWIARYNEMLGLRAMLDTDDLGLREVMYYSYAKVRRSVWEGFADMVFNVTKSVCKVITVLSGGLAAGVAEIVDAVFTIAQAIKRLIHAAKGVYKWIIGTKGVNREISAENIVAYAASGSEDAIKLIYIFKPFGLLGKNSDKQKEDKKYLQGCNWKEMKKDLPGILSENPDYKLLMKAQLIKSLTSMSTV